MGATSPLSILDSWPWLIRSWDANSTCLAFALKDRIRRPIACRSGISRRRTFTILLLFFIIPNRIFLMEYSKDIAHTSFRTGEPIWQLMTLARRISSVRHTRERNVENGSRSANNCE